MVPAVPTFAVDEGFWYSIPTSHLPNLGVGSIVRVPLGGRRVRGHVVEVSERPHQGLKPIGGVSGDMPIFDPRLRDALTWAAHHYVAPVSVLLERAGPPNLPARASAPPPGEITPGEGPAGLGEVVGAALADRRRPPAALLSPWHEIGWIESLLPLIRQGRSVMVVAATAAEVEAIASRCRRFAGDRVVDVTGDLSHADLTDRWSQLAAHPGMLAVGTPRMAAWPVAGLRLVAVIEEGRRSMKDRQTPTIAVRRLLMTRSRLEGLSQLYVGPTPSLELLAAGAEILRVGPRAWPLVEVIDKSEEPPGGGLISSRTNAAIEGTTARGGEVFVFTHRRGYAPAYRCASCRELRRCPGCGSRPEPGEQCARCGEPSRPCLNCGATTFEPLGAGVGRVLNELRGRFGDAAGEAEAGTPITVGSERDLASLHGVDLAVAVDVDGLALGTHFRATEEALRILARVAGRVRRGSGRRLILQTSLPDQPLVTALRRGDPIGFLEHEMAVRRSFGYPPATEMVVIEVRGGADSADGDIRSVAEDSAVTVMGPAQTPAGHRRWLIQGPSLGSYKLALRPVVQRWRDGGSAVRVDVDPIDL